MAGQQLAGFPLQQDVHRLSFTGSFLDQSSLDYTVSVQVRDSHPGKQTLSLWTFYSKEWFVSSDGQIICRE